MCKARSGFQYISNFSVNGRYHFYFIFFIPIILLVLQILLDPSKLASLPSPHSCPPASLPSLLTSTDPLLLTCLQTILYCQSFLKCQSKEKKGKIHLRWFSSPDRARPPSFRTLHSFTVCGKLFTNRYGIPSCQGDEPSVPMPCSSSLSSTHVPLYLKPLFLLLPARPPGTSLP